MDPELVRQHAAFKARASVLPSVSTAANEIVKKKLEEKKMKQKPKVDQKKKMVQQMKQVAKFDYKLAKASNTSNFSNLHKIVEHLKKRHLEQKDWPLTLSEVLNELQMYDVNKQTMEWLVNEGSAKFSEILSQGAGVGVRIGHLRTHLPRYDDVNKQTMEWLVNEGLPNNHRLVVELVDGTNKYAYKPPYKLKDGKSLLRLLQKYDLEGRGGVLKSDLLDSMANVDKHIQTISQYVVQVATSVNKKKDLVLFFNDCEQKVQVDDEFIALWRGVAVDHLEEKKIDDYLQKHGIDTIKDLAPKKSNQTVKRKTRKRQQIVHNEHLAETLEDYSVQ